MIAALALAVTGCTAPNPGDMVPTGNSSQLTYYQDAAPILANKCGACHTAGGIAPFALTSYDDAKAHALEIKDAVEAKVMPPLPPEQENCLPLDDPRNMTDAERSTLVAWAGGGAAPGDAAHPAPIEKPADPLGPATLTVDSGVDYTSTVTGLDDYRCFIIDPKITTAFPLIAAGTTSTNNAIVHHVIVYAQLPAQNAAVDALDAADPGPGYQCFGGPNFTNAIPVAASAVGSAPTAFPEGSGVPLPAGTRFVVQVHYNFDNGRGSNHLSLNLWQATAPLTQIPHGLTVGNYTFDIPAGAPDVSATGTGLFTETPANGAQTKPGKLWTIFPHMHLLGRSIYVELDRPDGSKQCLIDINGNWDFHWQGSYRLAQPVTVNAGDQVKVTCTWDNSAANQPIIDGEQQQPHDVRFGEGSTDEMCLAGMVLTN